jgi:hypothetical protein
MVKVPVNEAWVGPLKARFPELEGYTPVEQHQTPSWNDGGMTLDIYWIKMQSDPDVGYRTEHSDYGVGPWSRIDRVRRKVITTVKWEVIRG